MANTIKCPQCGAAHVEHVSQNKYSCPYCGNEFFVESDSIFVEQETDEFKLRQRIKREELKRAQKQKTKTKITVFWALILLVLPLCLAWFTISEIFKNKKLEFETPHEMCVFLEAAPFVCDNDTIVFSDFATKATINGKKYTSKPEKNEVSINIDGKHTSFFIYTSFNNSKAIICDDFDSEREFVRDANIPTDEYFEFTNESSVCEYLSNSIFANEIGTIRFEDNGNTFVFNDNRISSDLSITCMRGTWGNTTELKKSRACIIAVSGSGERYTLYLIMDQRGNNACLLDARNIKFKKIN